MHFTPNYDTVMRIFKRIILPCFLLCSLANAKAQTVPPDLEAILNHTLDSMRTVLNVKSLSAAIQFPNKAIWAHANGISSVVPPVQVTPDDAYLIGSVTKTITAACILQLVDEQVLSLEDSIGKWLAPMPNINPKVTIRQLLRHQSGIYDVLSNDACTQALLANQQLIWMPEDLISNFIKPQVFQPGTMWAYSNTNYFLLGMIIKKATGHFFFEEYRTRFFTPLGLNSFAIPAFEQLSVPVAHVWLDITGDGVTDDAHYFYMNYLALNSTAGAAGGYFSTASDLAKWTRTYMRGDLVSPALMTQAQQTVAAPGLPAATYGLGLTKKNFNGLTGLGHGGDLAYSASSWYFPTKDISISVLNNDAKNNSWTLAPVVSALLKFYTNWGMITGTETAVTTSDFSMSVAPNPFENNIRVTLQTPEHTSEIDLVLSNSLGKMLKTLKKQELIAGETIVEMDDLAQLAPGVYFLSAYADGHIVKTVKMVK
jgi:D-alanyl-D-alanine carboxypeptidase